VAKFFIGVVVGIFLGASVSALGAVASGSGTLSSWTVTMNGEGVCSGPNTTEACGRNNGSHFWRASRSR
jgi:hypothetical protein